MKKKIVSTTLPGRTIDVNGEPYLHFSGTSYLGISTHTEYINILIECIEQYGANFGGSRLSNIQFPVYEQAEQIIADLTESPCALTFSSGSYAGQMATNHFPEESIFIKNSIVHNAINKKGAIQLDLSMDADQEKLIEVLNKEHANPIVLLSNSIDPLFVNEMNFKWLERLPQRENLYIILDDSHSIGIYGQNGGGIYPIAKRLTNNKLIMIASLGKALGIPGGVVAGPATFIEELKRSSAFGGSSPIPPAYVNAFIRSRTLHKQLLTKVQHNISLFHKMIQQPALFKSIDQYPVFYTKENPLAEFLFENKIVLSSFPYPGPEDEKITRVVINASHTSEDIFQLTSKINSYQKR